MSKPVNDLSLHDNDTVIADHVRQIADRLLKQQAPGFHGVCIMASVYNLINMLEDMNAGNVEFKLSGFRSATHEGAKEYRIRVEEVEKKMK